MTNKSLNPIDFALSQLFALHWLDGLASQLSSLHREHGQPTAPEPTFGRTPVTLPFLSFAKVGPLGGYESVAVDAYNTGVKVAYSCIDCIYVGLMTGLANESKRPAAWGNYSLAARQQINQYFFSAEAFEDFSAYLLTPARNYLNPLNAGYLP